jgi:hypothetical protein
MHALILVVNLVAAASALEPELQLAPQLALAPLPGDAAASAGEPAPLGAAPTRRGLRGAEWVAASGVTLAGDALLAVTTAVGFALAFSNSDVGVPMLMVGAVGYVFLPPAFATSGAKMAGAPPGREGAAYAYGFLARLAASGAAALAFRASPQLAAGIWFASETVVMPYVVARTLGDVPVAPGGGTPLAFALPVRDPALAR